MRRLELALAVGDHDECTNSLGPPRDQANDVERRLVGPVHVLDHGDRRPHGAHLLEQRQEDGMRLLALVHGIREGTLQGRRHVDQRTERPRRPERVARPPQHARAPHPASRRTGAPACSCRCPPRPRRARACRPRRRRRRSSPPALPGTPSARADRPRHLRIRRPNPWRASCDARRAKSSSIGEVQRACGGAPFTRRAPGGRNWSLTPVLSRTRAPGGPCSRTGRPGSGTRSRRAS